MRHRSLFDLPRWPVPTLRSHLQPHIQLFLKDRFLSWNGKELLELLLSWLDFAIPLFLLSHIKNVGVLIITYQPNQPLSSKVLRYKAHSLIALSGVLPEFILGFWSPLTFFSASCLLR